MSKIRLAIAGMGNCASSLVQGITYYAVQLILRADAGIEIADPRDVAISKLRAATLAAFSGDVEEADAVARRVSVLAGFERAEAALPEVQPDGERRARHRADDEDRHDADDVRVHVPERPHCTLLTRRCCNAFAPAFDVGARPPMSVKEAGSTCPGC